MCENKITTFATAYDHKYLEKRKKNEKSCCIDNAPRIDLRIYVHKFRRS